MATQDEVREQLRRLVAADTFPTLDGFDLADLLRMARRPDYRGVLDADVLDPSGLPRTPAEGAHVEWAPATVYALDDIVIPRTRDGRVYRATTGGTSGTTEPVWTPTGTIADGTAVWEATTGVVWQPTYDIYAAAAEGWRWKAARTSDVTQFATQGDSYNADQVYQHCLEMAKYYDAKSSARSIPVVSKRTRNPYDNLPRAN